MRRATEGTLRRGKSLPAPQTVMHRQTAKLSLTAIGLIVAAAACFTAIDTIAKYLGPRYPVEILVWVRWGVPALLMTLFFAPKMHWGLLRTKNLKLHFVRGAVLILSSICFFTALKMLPLAEATGLNYLTPILVTLMAASVLSERITRPRWLFVVAGFAGMLLIVRPGDATMHTASLFALGAAALNATFQILTRKLADENLMVLIFYPSLIGAVVMTFAVPFIGYESSYPTSDLLLFLAIGTLGGLGHFLFIQAFQRAPASAISPFTYIQLVWSTLAGWLTFGAFPDVWALAGMIVIGTSGILLILYERYRARVPRLGLTGADYGQRPIMVIVPGAGVTETKFNEIPSGLAEGPFQLGVGQTAAVSYGAGPPKTVIRTD
jgi:drug/metabolite transporter (DMT)-like permease